jgi:ketosteroid isomerase-like protein
MNYVKTTSIFILLILFSCNTATNPDSLEKWKQEIRDVERDFAAMAESTGISEAFIHYAAEDAVLMRNDRLIIGKKQLMAHFGKSAIQSQDQKLSWKPDFVDVSSSGDLAYTYGHYIYTYTDSIGKMVEHKGVFHTVWKRQSDGSWRFVWD